MPSIFRRKSFYLSNKTLLMNYRKCQMNENLRFMHLREFQITPKQRILGLNKGSVITIFKRSSWCNDDKNQKERIS